MLPDVDVLLPFIRHRGATHSLTAILILIAMSLVHKDFLPYAASYASHIVLGDLITGKVRLLWPLSDAFIGARLLNMPSLLDTAAEVSLFAAMLSLPQFRKDWAKKRGI